MDLLSRTMVCASKASLEAAGLLPTCKKQARVTSDVQIIHHSSFIILVCDVLLFLVNSIYRGG